MVNFSPSLIWQFSHLERENKVGQNNVCLASTCGYYILKRHEITDVIPQFFPAGKKCGRNYPSKFKMLAQLTFTEIEKRK